MSALTPTEELVIEVLTARFRLGEHEWPFNSRLAPTMRSLEAKGLISWKSGVVERTVRAWFTDYGKATLSTTYKAPAQRDEKAALEALIGGEMPRGTDLPSAVWGASRALLLMRPGAES